MRRLNATLVLATWTALLPTALAAQGPGRPILDTHIHAFPADENGPPGQALCVPITSNYGPHDPIRPWGEAMAEMSTEPPCDDPAWAPATDEAVPAETVEMLERWHVYAVLSGTPDRVRAWRDFAPGRFIPGLQFQIGRDDISSHEVADLTSAGELEVFGEISNQYVGIAPDLIVDSIRVIGEAPFLSDEQKRDIFYNNAARFLRLSEEEIARHHGR